MLFSKQKGPELISLHIPKTAGTSFRNILKSVYGNKEVVRFDINERKEVRVDEVLYTKNRLPNKKVIHGHFPFELLTDKFDLPKDYKLITWMRDPVQRVISNFYYLEKRLKELLDEEKNNLNILSKMQRSLIEYARADINRNRQAKFLAGSSLEDFDFIGIQEDFNDELKRVSGILGWDDIPEALYHNKTAVNARSLDVEIMEEIKELNSDDMELYEQALKIKSNQ